MPVISLKIGTVPDDKKEALIEKLTSAAVEVTNFQPSSFIVFIEELEFENIGVGGQSLAKQAAKN